MPLATDLFNDASIAAQWTVEAGSASEEGASGRGSLLLSIEKTPIDPVGTPEGMRAPIDAGDFDVVIVWRWGAHTDGSAWFGFSVSNLANDTGVSVIASQGNDVGMRTLPNSSITLDTSAHASTRYRSREGYAMRIKRVGTTVTAYYMRRVNDTTQEPGTWEVLGTTADPLSGSGGYLRIGGRTTGSPFDQVELMAVYAGGPPAAAGAPSGGVAVSAPLADDSDLGVAFVWDAPGAGVARTVEVQHASNSGFTTALQRHYVDLLQAGEKPSVRRAGCTLGQTIYGRARFVDELGQVGSWSSTVSAVVAVSPTVVPTYEFPLNVLRLSGGALRVVRLS